MREERSWRAPLLLNLSTVHANLEMLQRKARLGGVKLSVVENKQSDLWRRYLVPAYVWNLSKEETHLAIVWILKDVDTLGAATVSWRNLCQIITIAIFVMITAFRTILVILGLPALPLGTDIGCSQDPEKSILQFNYVHNEIIKISVWFWFENYPIKFTRHIGLESHVTR